MLEQASNVVTAYRDLQPDIIPAFEMIQADKWSYRLQTESLSLLKQHQDHLRQLQQASESLLSHLNEIRDKDTEDGGLTIILYAGKVTSENDEPDFNAFHLVNSFASKIAGGSG